MIDLQAEFDRACGSFEGEDFDSLPERDRILIAIWELEAEVNTDQAWFAPVALERIGALRMASIVREANSAFGGEGPSRHRFTRQNQLAAVTAEDDDGFDTLDSRFYEYPEDISALLIAYLETTSA